MKYLLILALTLVASASFAQQKHLPDTSRVKLTPTQIIAISTRIDSLQSALTNTSTLPGVTISGLNQRLQIALSVMYRQINEQLVLSDTTKKAPKKK